MQNNYYFLKQLSQLLKKKLKEYQLLTCFSQQKDELVLGFGKDSHEFYIKAVLKSDFSCLTFPKTFHRARKNSVELFREVIDLDVTTVVQHENERSFSIYFKGDYSLLFKMHGNRANIILLYQGKVFSCFKNNLVKDKSIDPDKLDRYLDQSFENFKANEGDLTILFPTFGKVINKYLKERNYYEVGISEKWKLVCKTLQKLESQKYYHILMNNKLTFSMIEIGLPKATYTNLFEAINDFYYDYTRISQLEKERSLLIKALQNSQKKSYNYINKAEAKLTELTTGRKLNEIADIIMANLNLIPQKAEWVELHDFYNEKPIKIKLKKELSPQNNAENYYRKSKNLKIQIEKLRENINHRKKELTSTDEKLSAIRKVDNLKELRKLTNRQIESEKKQKNQQTLPFKKYNYLNFEIWIGKNASGNDMLTQKYARKEDLWLHAKDVSGSHVIIKTQAGKQIPKDVLEKAAALAAFFSKRKKDSLCPVIYTEKKFVRKPKGSPPGAVLVEKMKVILVEPAGF